MRQQQGRLRDLQVASGVILLLHARFLPGWLAAGAAALLAAGMWIAKDGRTAAPQRLLDALALAAVGMVYVQYGTLASRDAGIGILVALVAVKLCGIRRARDELVVILLDLFLLVCAMTRFGLAGQIGAAALVLPLLVSVHVAINGPASGRGRGERCRVALGALALGGPIAALAFGLVGMADHQLWGRRGAGLGARTGLSATMSPGDVAALVDSGEIAFVAKFIVRPPGAGALYWRAATMSEYDGATWRPDRRWSQEGRAQAPAAAPRLEHGSGRVIYEIILEPQQLRWLPTVGAPAEVSSNIVAMRPRILGDLHVESEQAAPYAVLYRVAAYTDFALDKSIPEAELAPYLALPVGAHPKALALASRLRAPSGADSVTVSNALHFIATGGFSYTKTPPSMGKDAVDGFLFDTRAGFCEHYASAFAVLMRAAGVPARVVIGYQGGRVRGSGADQYWTIHQSDAHAWDEVWLRGRGWVRVDPTTMAAVDTTRSTAAESIFALFGPREQVADGSESGIATEGEFFGAAVHWVRAMVTRFAPAPDASSGSRLARAAGAIVVIAGIFGAVAYARRRRGAGAQTVDQAQLLYEKLCRKMAKRGLARHLHEGPAAYAERIGPVLPVAARAAFGEFIGLYIGLRYGGRAPTQVAHKRMRQLLRRFGWWRGQA